MPRFPVLAAAALLCSSAAVAAAQQHDMAGHSAHGAMSVPDAREMLHFPPEMQSNFLGNMRDHMQTLDGILHAVAAKDYAGASRIASERLGLDSPSAAGCKPGSAAASETTPQTPSAAPGSMSQMSMDQMMALYMPAAMRAVGLSMHTSASEFATVATQAATTHDDAAVLGVLSRVTQNCVACHSSYRLH